MLSFEVVLKSTLIGKFHLAKFTLVRLEAIVDFLYVSDDVWPEEFLADRALVRLELQMNVFDVVLQPTFFLESLFALGALKPNFWL